MKTNKFFIPSPEGYNNWAALDAKHVVLGCESWLVLHFEEGQDNIGEESVLFSTPNVPDAWVNREQWEKKEVNLTYEWGHWLYKNRELILSEIEVEGTETKIYSLGSPGCGAITPEAKIYLNGVEVQKMYLPEIPNIYGISGLKFYSL